MQVFKKKKATSFSRINAFQKITALAVDKETTGYYVVKFLYRTYFCIKSYLPFTSEGVIRSGEVTQYRLR
jgi:hypothetical protein